MVRTDVPSSKPRMSVYLDQELKERFEQLCSIRKRSSSNMLEVMIEKEISEAEANGELPKNDA